MQARVAEAEAAVFQGVSETDRQALTALVERLAVSIHSEHPYVDPCLAVVDVLAEPPRTGR